MYKFVLIATKEDQASNSMIDYLLELEEFLLVDSYRNNKQNSDDCSRISQASASLIPEYKSFESVKHDNTILMIFQHDLINLTNIDDIIPKNSILLFLSKHVSKNKIPALTSHFTGNFGSSNIFGGSPYEVGIAFPTFQKEYMKQLELSLENLNKFDLTIEASHHGPTSSRNPIMFIEIGSTEDDWKNKFAAAAVCKSLLNTVAKFKGDIIPTSSNIAIGLGGNHYPQKFNDLILKSNIAFASIASKYNLENINEAMLGQMKSKSVEPVTEIFLDKKGVGSERQRLVRMAESQGLIVNLI